MKWFVGLGNPGRKYADNRHNVGFMALDRLSAELGLSWKASRFKADWAEGRIGNEKIVLLKPQTFMNLSGESIRSFMDYYDASLDDLIVVYDDLDTELGRIRLRYKGGSGGHNGIKSIISHTGTEQFKRIRIGISRPPEGGDVVSYVLSDFARKERPVLQEVLDLTASAMKELTESEFDQVMGQYNTRSANG